MDKKHGRTGSKSLSGAASAKATADRRQAGEGSLGHLSRAGSDGTGLWINERGEQCYGDKCLQIACDEERGEIRVIVKPGATCKIDPLVQVITRLLGKGDARTVYEVESEFKKEPE